MGTEENKQVVERFDALLNTQQLVRQPGFVM
jgi:hypothetical protein